MNTDSMRIIKRGGIYFIQKPRTNWFGKPTGQWETLGNADWAAVYSSLEDAQRQIRHWRGEDVDRCNVIA